MMTGLSCTRPEESSIAKKETPCSMLREVRAERSGSPYSSTQEDIMHTWTRRLARLGFALVVMGGLGFGINQALATPPRTDDCQPCATTEECRTCCRAMNFEDGECFPPNCLCI